jgi:hypothetical protein
LRIHSEKWIARALPGSATPARLPEPKEPLSTFCENAPS